MWPRIGIATPPSGRRSRAGSGTSPPFRPWPPPPAA